MEGWIPKESTLLLPPPAPDLTALQNWLRLPAGSHCLHSCSKRRHFARDETRGGQENPARPPLHQDAGGRLLPSGGRNVAVCDKEFDSF